jgi:hypothetical protein
MKKEFGVQTGIFDLSLRLGHRTLAPALDTTNLPAKLAVPATPPASGGYILINGIIGIWEFGQFGSKATF